jgi:N-formylglutamate deformylase
MDLYRFTAGTAPIIVSAPHPGTFVPDAIEDRLTPEAAALPDTDWHIDRLYAFAAELGASTFFATHSRYVVDLNRDPDDKPLYPGADNTEVCPTTTFHKQPIYREAKPSRAEIAARVDRYWRPWHAHLAAEIDKLRRRHHTIVLFDAHSIASVLPRFFEGTLPVFNLGTSAGAACDGELSQRLMAVFDGAAGYDAVRDGRFKGGYVTRRYGRPAEGVHAVQLEMAQRAYMDEAAPYGYRSDLAAGLLPTLRRAIETARDWAVEKGMKG